MTLASEVAASLPRALESYPDQSGLSLYQLLVDRIQLEPFNAVATAVIDGGLQAWWIAPVLSRLTEAPLFLAATVLTAFNDNAMITFLATLVPDLSESLKVVVVEGAVTGGGLTMIAHAPNPAGQTLLSRFFGEGISPIGLFLGALAPTIIAAIAFRLL